ncbi:MAG: ComEC/Rec2 family competence protein [Deltaproteobacteria bacterium]|nr:ComEC/Rec2 family competence protein [Deltaproteobacteria bacterium]
MIIGGFIWGLVISSFKVDMEEIELKDKDIIFDGYIAGSPSYNRDNTIYQVDVQRYILNGKITVKNFTMEYVCSNPFAEPVRGDLIRGRCKFYMSEDNKPICISELNEPPMVIERTGFGILNRIDEYKKGISKFIFSRYKGDIGSILIALSTGNAKELSYEIRRLFSRAGTAHILAISGTHIGLISIIIYYFLKVIFFPLTYIRPFSIRKLSSLCLIPILICVSFYFGNAPSVVRAVVMIIIYLFSIIIERERDILSSLCFAFVLITSFSPDSIRDIGLQLSFLSVLGIVISLPSFLEKSYFEALSMSEAFLGILKSLFFTSLSATIFTLPVVAFHFGVVSISGILSNIILVPFTGLVVLPMIVLGVLVFGIAQTLTSVFFNGAFVALEQFNSINSIFASIPFSHIKMFVPSYPEIISYYLVVLALTLRKSIPISKILIVLLFIVMCITYFIMDRVEKNKTKPVMFVRGGIIVLIDDDNDAFVIAERHARNRDKRRIVEFLRGKRIVKVFYTNVQLQDDLYIVDHLYVRRSGDYINVSERGDILVNFLNFHIYILNDIAICPPSSARYIISRRVSSDAVAKIHDCGISAEKLIFSGIVRNQKLPNVLYRYYGEDASKILMCRDEDCEVLIQPDG